MIRDDFNLNEINELKKEIYNLLRGGHKSCSPRVQRRHVVREQFREPVCDLFENEKEVIATLEVPGVNKEEIQINADAKGVSIKVEKKKEEKKEVGGASMCERSQRGFFRYLRMPQNVDVSRIDATYKNGVLELRIPKKAVEQKITVEVK